MHLRTFTLGHQGFRNTFSDVLFGQAGTLKRFHNDCILDVFQDLNIDPGNGIGTFHPHALNSFVVLKVIFPNPGSTVCGNIFRFRSDCFTSFQLLGIELFDLGLLTLLLLTTLFLLFFRLLIIFFEGHSSLSHKDSLTLLALLVLDFIIFLPLLNAQDVAHSHEGAKIRDHSFEAVLVLGVIDEKLLGCGVVQG